MSDRYLSLINTPVGKQLVKRLGLPNPTILDRYQAGRPVIEGGVLLGGTASSELIGAIGQILRDIQADVYADPQQPTVQQQAAQIGLTTRHAAEGAKYKALVFDASGLESVEQLSALYEFFHPVARSLLPSSRLLVVGRPPEACVKPHQAIVQRALEGFIRSLGKEVKQGATVQLIYVAAGAEQNLDSTLRFFLSPRSAYVSGQVIRVKPGSPIQLDWQKPLAGRTALVTGASRGIGEAIAQVLARDGATVICLDVPAQETDLKKVADRIGGRALTLDITAPDAGEKIAQAAGASGLDIIVHNAGIIRDKMLANMSAQQWQLVTDINLGAIIRINDYLLTHDALNANGRIVCVSSIGGIAGNAGQTNYATSKAGVIGVVQALAPTLKQDRTINAVAPGFIETAMTSSIPFAIREVGRRMNAMNQGGLPVDVAEAIAWFASPASSGINGSALRVCGQSMLGA